MLPAWGAGTHAGCSSHSESSGLAPGGSVFGVYNTPESRQLCWELPVTNTQNSLAVSLGVGNLQNLPLGTDLQIPDSLVPERAKTEAWFVRNLIIQIYYHQELCNDAVVFLTNRKQTVYNSELYSTSIHKVKMNVSSNITNPGLLILTEPS